MSSTQQQGKRVRVGVLFGGQSGEHEVSLASAKGIMAAMDSAKFEVVPIGIDKAGHWLAGGDVHNKLLAEAALKVWEAPLEQAAEQSLALPIAETGPLDIIFPVLHGPLGEDGTVQGFLELAGVPYVGSGVAASALAMDKALCKEIFKAHGLPIVKHQTFLRRQWHSEPDKIIAVCESALTYPMFAKPANLGSSVGVHKVHNRQDLIYGLNDAARYDRKIIVEQGIEAREIEVSVLGNDEPLASMPGEIVPSREFYSYAAKYIDNNSELLIPAPLSKEQVELVQQLAIRAFKALDCAGLARCDFLLEVTTGKLYLNELNTMPGFTPISMYPKLWEASGLPYGALIERLIELGMERFDDNMQSRTGFDVTRAE